MCEGAPAARGHLFLFTNGGLTLAASNTACDSPEALAAFAQSSVDIELDQGSVINSEVPTTGTKTIVPTGHFEDANGTRYSALLLGTTQNDTFQVAGVAILTDDNGARHHDRARLVHALAKNLLDSGDARGVCAA